jgi:hypothetical protein
VQTLCTGKMFPPPLQPLARLPRPTSAGRSFPQRAPRTDRRCALENVNRPLLGGECTGTCVTLWTGDIRYKPLAVPMVRVDWVLKT